MRRLRTSTIAVGAAAIALWTAAAGCDPGSMRAPAAPKEAARGIGAYCPEKLGQALRERIPRSGFVSVDYCLCSDIPPCDLCDFSQREQTPAAQQQVASFGEVVCQVLTDPQCCNCCAALSASGGGEQQPIR